MADDAPDREQFLRDLRDLLAIVDRRLTKLHEEGRSDAIRQLEEIRSLTVQTMDSLSAPGEVGDPSPP